jgi:hypothetical protein
VWMGRGRSGVSGGMGVRGESKCFGSDGGRMDGIVDEMG